MLLGVKNIIFAFADRLNKRAPYVFSDSKVARQNKVGHMKATFIINEALAPAFLMEAVEVVKNVYFSLSTDDYIDSSLENVNPSSFRLYDVYTSRVVTQFIDTCSTAHPVGRTAEFIFNAIDEGY